jgi:hypothetical protein
MCHVHYVLFTTKITKDTQGLWKGGFKTRPYNFVLFVSFVVKTSSQ